MENLRNELIETQKVRTDLIKWKLILVSTLGAAALGLTNTGATMNITMNIKILLCCIPVVCAYTDMQYTNLALRISGIATFSRKIPIRQNHESMYIKNYEIFMDKVRRKIQTNVTSSGKYSLQTLVMLGSSLLLSILIIWIGANDLFNGVYGFKNLGPIRFWSQQAQTPLCVFWAGVLGFGFTLLIYKHYQKRNKIIKDVGDTFLFAKGSFTNSIKKKPKNYYYNVVPNLLYCTNVPYRKRKVEENQYIKKKPTSSLKMARTKK